MDQSFVAKDFEIIAKEIVGSSSNKEIKDPDIIKGEVCSLPYTQMDFVGLLLTMLELDVNKYIVVGTDGGKLGKIVTLNLKRIEGDSYNPQVVSVRNHASLEKLVLT